MKTAKKMALYIAKKKAQAAKDNQRSPLFKPGQLVITQWDQSAKPNRYRKPQPRSSWDRIQTL